MKQASFLFFYLLLNWFTLSFNRSFLLFPFWKGASRDADICPLSRIGDHKQTKAAAFQCKLALLKRAACKSCLIWSLGAL